MAFPVLETQSPFVETDSSARPDLPFCTPGCCEGECVVRTKFIEQSDEGAAHGARLSALDGSDLSERFYCWRGADGVRYVCTIFSRAQEAIVGDFSDVIVIGVARTGEEVRPVCLMPSKDFDTPAGRAARERAHDLGCSEWHVYFNNDPARVRELAVALGV
jgi:hypothetical protein